MITDDPPNKGSEVVEISYQQPTKRTLPAVRSEEWADFDTHFSELFNPDSPSGLSMYSFLRRTLRQFHLENSYSEAYILNEAYVRAIKLIVPERVTIHHPSCWLKKTAYNICRELSREQKKTAPLENKTLERLEQSPALSDALETDLQILEQARKRLTPEDDRLLDLKVIQGLSWRSIREIYASEGQDYTEDALRKQKERALKKLRQIYHSLKPLYEI